MHIAFEYVQNFSTHHVPEPCELSPEEKRKLFDCQRREHLENYDDAYKRDPLTGLERQWLDGVKARLRHAQLIRYGDVEMPFKPGQIYQVPAGVADKIVAMCPDRLRKLTWHEVRLIETDVTEAHFQTVEEARKQIEEISRTTGTDGIAIRYPVVSFEI